MPPVFTCQPGSESCQETLLHSSKVITLADCQAADHIFGLNKDISVADGDTTLNAPISTRITVYDSKNNVVTEKFVFDEANQALTKCGADVEEDVYVIEFHSFQDNLPTIRYINYYHVVNLGQPAAQEGELVKLSAESSSVSSWGIDWESPGNLYVVDMENAGTKMQFVKEDGVEGELVWTSKTSGFVLDQDGYVICTSCARGNQATFDDANLEVYAFVIEDETTTHSQLFDSLVSIENINTEPETTTKESTTTTTTAATTTITTLDPTEECIAVCTIDKIIEICKEEENVELVCDDEWKEKDCPDYCMDETVQPEVCDDYCNETICPDYCTDEDRKPEICDDYCQGNVCPDLCPDFCDTEEIKDIICPDYCSDCNAEDICTPDFCQEIIDENTDHCPESCKSCSPEDCEQECVPICEEVCKDDQEIIEQICPDYCVEGNICEEVCKDDPDIIDHICPDICSDCNADIICTPDVCQEIIDKNTDHCPESCKSCSAKDCEDVIDQNPDLCDKTCEDACDKVPTPDGTSMGTWEIATICLFVVLGLLIIAIIVFFCCCNNREYNNSHELDHEKLVHEASMSTTDPIELRKTKMHFSHSDDEDDVSDEYQIEHIRAVAPVTAVAMTNASFAQEETKQPSSSPSPIPPTPTPPPPPPLIKAAAVVTISTAGKKSPAPPPMKATKTCPMEDPRFRTLADKQIRLDSAIKAGKIYSAEKTNLSKQQEELEKIMLDMEISKIRHDSILQYYGAWVADGNAHLAYEFAGKGRLDEFLVQAREGSFNSVSKLSNYKVLNIITEIAKGLSHLHQRQIIHGNLRAAHILITDEGQPKLASIGYPDIKEDRARYWAPELFVKQEYTRESDIWAFGVVVWELSSFGGLPYSNLNLADIEQYIKMERLPMPQNCTAEMYAFMSQCWKQEPRSRPDSYQLVHNLQEKLINNAYSTSF